jgi:hypothetical protein
VEGLVVAHVEGNKHAYAEAYVQLAGFDPRSAEGQKRANAILVAAEVCETWSQFTRAAQAAVEQEFGAVQYTPELTPAVA